MNKRILGGLAAAVMLTGGLALSSGATQAVVGPNIVVGGISYAPTKAPNAGVYHYSLPGVGIPKSASVLDRGQTWNGKNGADLGCESGTYWVSNNSRLVISHCVGDLEPTEVTPSFDYMKPTCEAAGTAAPVETVGILWVPGEGGVSTASAIKGYILADGSETKFGPFVLNQLTGDDCEVTEEEPTPTPTPTPEVEVIPPAAPTNRPPPNRSADVVAASSPAQSPPAEVLALPSVLPAQALPSTGIDGTGITAIIALLLTSLGGAALFLSRRRSTTI